MNRILYARPLVQLANSLLSPSILCFFTLSVLGALPGICPIACADLIQMPVGLSECARVQDDASVSNLWQDSSFRDSDNVMDTVLADPQVPNAQGAVANSDALESLAPSFLFDVLSSPNAASVDQLSRSLWAEGAVSAASVAGTTIRVAPGIHSDQESSADCDREIASIVKDLMLREPHNWLPWEDAQFQVRDPIARAETIAKKSAAQAASFGQENVALPANRDQVPSRFERRSGLIVAEPTTLALLLLGVTLLGIRQMRPGVASCDSKMTRHLIP